MATTILVTGATGTVGAAVLKQLTRMEGVTVLAADRSATSDNSRSPEGHATPVGFDFAKPDVMAAALSGVEKVFLLTPFVQDQVEIASRFIALAEKAGVKHVVKLSVFGSEIEPGIMATRAHRAVERALERSSMAWTFLRPNNFMENFVGVRHRVYAPDTQGNIRVPWGQGACSFIAVEDIAAVASLALTADGHAGKAYTLTGPEALTMDQAAHTLASVTGRAIRYVDVQEDDVKRGMLAQHLPEPLVDGVMELHAFNKAGRGATVTSTVREVTGRPARSLRDFATVNAAKWKV